MNPCHHPSEDRLLEHATGALNAGRDLVVAAHVRVCPVCQAEVAAAEAIGGALLDELPAAPMEETSLDRMLARIDRPAPPDAAERPSPRPDWIGFSSPALEAAWRRRRWAAPGVWVAPVSQGPGKSRGYLLRVGAGMSVPTHKHRGVEMVCVLKGAYADGDQLHGPGDFAENDEAVAHRPKATGDGECVCLIWTDAPLVPLDWVGRLFQPLVRI